MNLLILALVLFFLITLFSLGLIKLTLENLKITKNINNKNLFQNTFYNNPNLNSQTTTNTIPNTSHSSAASIKYLTNTEINSKLSQITQNCSDISELISLGNSFNNQEIKGIKFSSNKNLQNDKNSNSFSQNLTRIGLIGNMHGNEATGRSILTWFIDNICEEKYSEFSQTILQNSILYIIPTINPDGFSDRLGVGTYGDANLWVKGRYAYDPNCYSSKCDTIDMNRDFPDASAAFHDDNSIAFDTDFFENSETFQNNYSQNSKSKESQLVKKFFKENPPFDFALNFHDGATVVSYPLDLAESYSGSGVYSKSPDDKLYRKLAKAYSDGWPNIENSCRNEFPTGITNGAHWYSLAGGLQDYSYLVYGTMHMTIEVSCTKFPNEQDLSTIVEDNKNSIRNYMNSIVRDINFPKIFGNNLARAGQKIKFEKEGLSEVYFTYVVNDGSFKRILPESGNWKVSDENDEILGTFSVIANTEIFI